MANDVYCRSTRYICCLCCFSSADNIRRYKVVHPSHRLEDLVRASFILRSQKPLVLQLLGVQPCSVYGTPSHLSAMFSIGRISMRSQHSRLDLPRPFLYGSIPPLGMTHFGCLKHYASCPAVFL